MGVRAAVRVPASSANLGPGFDALGLALALYDDVTAEVTSGGITVMVTGEGAGDLPGDDRHLVVRAMRATFDALGAAPAGLSVTCHNRIPQARGLGSSSAAIVAGVLLARALVERAGARPADGGAGARLTTARHPGGAVRSLDDDEVLALAARLEGHADNVAACLRGGVTIAWTDHVGARAVRLAPAPGIRPVVFVPTERGLTTAARAALPRTVPHADAAHATGRAALLVHALTAAPDLLFEATEDRLHQPYRAPGMPAAATLVERLRAAGVAAVLSGAGPTVLALSPVPAGFEPGSGVVSWQVPVDPAGAVVTTG